LRIIFKDEDLQLACTDPDLGIRRWGESQAKVIRRRLDELQAAETLDDMRYLRGAGCHELKGQRRGTLAVRVSQPYRLIFKPAECPAPRKPDGGLDWTKVKAIIVLEVVDYH